MSLLDSIAFLFFRFMAKQIGFVTPVCMSLGFFKQVQAKNLKGRTVIGVAAGRFHSVLWTKEAVYTMGLNGGQLGERE